MLAAIDPEHAHATEVMQHLLTNTSRNSFARTEYVVPGAEMGQTKPWRLIKSVRANKLPMGQPRPIFGIYSVDHTVACSFMDCPVMRPGGTYRDSSHPAGSDYANWSPLSGDWA